MIHVTFNLEAFRNPVKRLLNSLLSSAIMLKFQRKIRRTELNRNEPNENGREESSFLLLKYIRRSACQLNRMEQVPRQEE